jgi:putative addiction module killer protein
LASSNAPVFLNTQYTFHFVRDWLLNKTIIFYTLPTGRVPFREWLESIRDRLLRKRIEARLAYVRQGNLGDHKSVGGGVNELRLHFGPGFRIYYGESEGTLVVLLCAGDKATQDADIRLARLYWEDFEETSSRE